MARTFLLVSACLAMGASAATAMTAEQQMGAMILGGAKRILDSGVQDGAKRSLTQKVKSTKCPSTNKTMTIIDIYEWAVENVASPAIDEDMVVDNCVKFVEEIHDAGDKKCGVKNNKPDSDMCKCLMPAAQQIAELMSMCDAPMMEQIDESCLDAATQCDFEGLYNEMTGSKSVDCSSAGKSKSKCKKLAKDGCEYKKKKCVGGDAASGEDVCAAAGKSKKACKKLKKECKFKKKKCVQK